MACEMLRCKIVWTGWAIRRLFAMRHLPNIVKFRQFQTSKIPCIFCNFVSKLSFSVCFTSGHWNPKGFSLQCFQGPSHKALVFDWFNRKPERLPKLCRTLIALRTEFLLLLRRVVSSVNRLIFSSF